MAQVICRVIKKFNHFNVGESLSADEKQVQAWVARDLVVRVPPAVPHRAEAPVMPQPEPKAEDEPPMHKMVEVADEAKGDDTEAPRRGRGRRRG